jgi:hypothetical protein
VTAGGQPDRARVSNRSRWVALLLTGVVLTVVAPAATNGCGSEPGERAPAADAGYAVRSCGDDDLCTGDQFCVTTQGAVCQPLPPPGEECPVGCVLTEHCCNCATMSCATAPAEPCPAGPSCGCLPAAIADGFLLGCPEQGRQCTEEAEGVDVLCVIVGLDEDPFADGGL